MSKEEVAKAIISEQEAMRIVGFVQFLLKEKQHIWKAYEVDVCWFDAGPFQIVVSGDGPGRSLMDIQIHRPEQKQLARDAELWWQERRGIVVWRDPAGLFEAIGTKAPLEAIAWASA